MYSLIVTAKLNDVDPQAWLGDVLARIAEHRDRLGVSKSPRMAIPRRPDRDGVIEITFGCGARVRLRGEVSDSVQVGKVHFCQYV